WPKELIGVDRHRFTSARGNIAANRELAATMGRPNGTMRNGFANCAWFSTDTLSGGGSWGYVTRAIGSTVAPAGTGREHQAAQAAQAAIKRRRFSNRSVR